MPKYYLPKLPVPVGDPGPTWFLGTPMSPLLKRHLDWFICFSGLCSSRHTETAQGPDLLNILRQSYDNAKVTIDLRRTSNVQNTYKRRKAFPRYDSLAEL